jgi:hypothetical protein
MSIARQQAMADIQAQINATQYAPTATGATQATQFYPSNNPNNVVNPYENIAPPPPPNSGEPGIPDNLDITEENEKNFNISALYGKTARYLNNVRRGARSRGYRLNRWLGGIPTPGGVWVPFWLLIFLWMILIPVNGHTRLRWLWNTFFGFSQLAPNEISSQPIPKGSVNQDTTEPVTPIQTIIWQTPGNSYLYTSALGEL